MVSPLLRLLMLLVLVWMRMDVLVTMHVLVVVPRVGHPPRHRRSQALDRRQHARQDSGGLFARYPRSLTLLFSLSAERRACSFPNSTSFRVSGRLRHGAHTPGSCGSPPYDCTANVALAIPFQPVATHATSHRPRLWGMLLCYLSRKNTYHTPDFFDRCCSLSPRF